MKPGLFLTDAQIAEQMGIQTDALKVILPALAKEGFPAPDPLIQNRRYWPACKLFLDRRYGIATQSVSGNPAPDGEEKW